METENLSATVHLKLRPSARADLRRAAYLAGASDFSEWARRVLIKEAKKVLAQWERDR